MDPIVGVVLGLVSVLAVVAGFFVFRRSQRPMFPAPGGDALPEPEAPSLFGRMGEALQRTRQAFSDALGGVFGREKVDESAFEALEEALIRADIGAKASMGLVAALRAQLPPGSSGDALKQALRGLLKEKLKPLDTKLKAPSGKPHVILVVGVNGSGKTTTIGKLAARMKGEGQQVVLGAGDTFRAGAIEQLKVWGERAEVPVVAHGEGADPAAVCHDAVQSAIARGADVVICDTAGRLQAHKALMDELAKIRRVIGKLVPGAPHEVLLVLDATMGQNAVSQARIFQEVAGVTGIVLTKLDGTAKGGVVVAIAEEFQLPVKLVGVGEKVEDLRNFEPDAFVEALF